MYRNSKAPFNFVVNLMIPGPQKLALVITWAAEQAPTTGSSHHSSPEGHTGPHFRRQLSSASSQAETDSEAGGSPFDTILARYKSFPACLGTISGGLQRQFCSAVRQSN